MKKFPDLFLQGCVLVWMHPCAICVPRGFGAELELRWAGSSIPRACWQLSPRWEEWGRRQEPEPCDCSNLTGPGRSQVAGAEAMEVGLNPNSTPCECTLTPPSLTLALLPQRGRAGGRRAGAAPGMDGCACGATLAHLSELRPCFSGPSHSGCPAPSLRECVPVCVPL